MLNVSSLGFLDDQFVIALVGSLLACDVCVYCSVQFQHGFILKVDMVIL
jgi:hypothetical protein